jgi:hypothetical protein
MMISTFEASRPRLYGAFQQAHCTRDRAARCKAWATVRAGQGELPGDASTMMVFVP